MEGSSKPQPHGLASWSGILLAPAAVPRALQRVLVMALLLLAALTASPRATALDFARLQLTATQLGPRAERIARELRDLVVRMAGLDEATRLERVNDFINLHVAFVPDRVAWNQEDYWATPLQTLARAQGDCEDYAIAKYFVLIAAGTPAAQLRLVYVRAALSSGASPAGGSQAHMVLAHYADNAAEPLILDNLVTDIRPASRRSDLTPVFSFNGIGLWNGAGPQPAGDPLARLSRWRDVLQRARAEGFQ